MIAEFPFTLEDGGEYVVVATGLLGNEDTPFTLVALVQHLAHQMVM